MTDLPQQQRRDFSTAMLVLVVFAAGIFVDRYWTIGGALAFGLAAFFWFGWLLSFVLKLERMGAICLISAVFLAGSFWHHGNWNWFPAQDLASYAQENSQPVCLVLQILGDGRLSVIDETHEFNAIPQQEKNVYQVRPIAIRHRAEWLSVKGQCPLVVHGQLDQNLVCGDEVKVWGRLLRFRGPTTPGAFDAKKYYRAQQQACAVFAFESKGIVRQKMASPYSLQAQRSQLRSYFNQLLWRHIGAQHAGFASAILLGNRNQIPRSKRQRFLKTGTAHLLAISGLHVGILASVFLFAYQIGLLRRSQALLCTILFVVFYAWLVEFRPPVVRAAVLLSLFCVSKLIGRQGGHYRLLAIAGIVILILRPTDLFQLGPQLSFLAVATLINYKDWIFPPRSRDPIDRLVRTTRPAYVRWFHHVFERCRQLIFIGLAIWLVGLPVVAANFKLVTPIAFVVNPVVTIPIGIALFAGLGVGVFGGWVPWLADLLGVVNSKSLAMVDAAIEVADGVAGGHWWTAGPILLSVVVFYTGFLLMPFLGRNQPRHLFAWLAIWALVGWLVPFQMNRWIDRNFQDQAIISVIDVGHGAGILLQLPYGKTILYDAGSISSASFAAETISHLLWSEQIEHLDAVIVSHADLDHFNALPELTRRFSIGVVYLSAPMLAKESGSKDALVSKLASAGIEIRELAWDDFVELPETRIQVLSPPEVGTGDSDNSNSIVLRLDTCGRTVLLPGDLERNGMQLLLQSVPIDCDWAMLPHHGSKNSRPVEFSRWCCPQSVVASVATNKFDRKVAAELEATGCNVLTTGDLGTIRYETGPNEWRFSHYSNSRWQPIE